MSFAAEANARQRALVVGMLQKSVSEGRVPASEYEARKTRIEEASASAAALSAPPHAPLADQAETTRNTDELRAQDHDDGLDSVERSLQTLDAYLDTLKKHLPPTAQCFHELGLESYKEFKKMLGRGEDALVHAYASPANPSASPIADLIQAAVDEAMAESS